MDESSANNMQSALRITPRQYQALATLVIGLLALWAFWPSIQGLLQKWLLLHDAYGHGLLTLALALWLAKRQRDRLQAVPYDGWFHPVALLLVSVAWACAFLIHTEILQQMLLPVLAALIGSRGYGKAGFLRLLGALGILYFAIPFWDYLNAGLQWLSVQISSAALRINGIDASINGFFVTLPNGVFEIAGGCSGLRYLLVSLTLTYLYAFMNFSRARYAVILVSAGVLFALVSNWVRVFLIIYLGHRSNMTDPLVADHESFGWALYAATLVPLFALAHYCELQDKRSRQSARVVRPRASEVADAVPRPRSTARGWGLTLASTIAVPFGTQLIVALSQPMHSYGELFPPETIGHWNRVVLLDNLYVAPAYSGYTQRLDSSYSRGAGEPLLSLNLRLYSRQFNGKELINNQNREFDLKTWQLKGNFASTDKGYQYLELEHRQTLARHVVGYTYAIGDQLFSNKFDAKLGQLAALVSLRRLDGALVQASTPCGSSCSEAAGRLEDFFAVGLITLREALLRAYEDSR